MHVQVDLEFAAALDQEQGRGQDSDQVDLEDHLHEDHLDDQGSLALAVALQNQDDLATLSDILGALPDESLNSGRGVRRGAR